MNRTIARPIITFFTINKPDRPASRRIPALDPLTQLFKNGGCTADQFRQVVDRTRDDAYALACRLLHDPAEAGDVVQEAYIRTWKHRYRFDGRVLFTTWFHKIIVHLCFDQIKKRQRRQAAMDSYQREMQPASSEDENRDEKTEKLERIICAARDLPPKQQLIFMLRDLQDMEMDEVAEITGLSLGAIKSNLYYARKALFQRLK
jgi:RNA polymerase sigma-70 factor, ECF subfamily